MKLKVILAGLIASTLTVPALAQTPGSSPSSPSTFGGAGTWYVVQDIQQ
jgi:hypothetical protein